MYRSLLLLLGVASSITAAGAHSSIGDGDLPGNNATDLTHIPSRSHSQINNGSKLWPYRSYKSNLFNPPVLEITGPGGDLAPGYIFLTPSNSEPHKAGAEKENLALIMDNDGEPVFAWVLPDSTDLRVQQYNGTPHLTVWNGYSNTGLDVGHGYGQVHFWSQNYTGFAFNPHLHINTGLSRHVSGIVDLHEHQMTASGESMIITSYNNTPADLTSFAINDGWVVDSLVAEFDVKTEELLFLWNPADHGVSYNLSKVPIKSMTAGNGTEAAPWDWCHINSAEKVGDNYLINSRHLWTTWLVNGTNGDIIWEINGYNGGDFGAFPDGATFSWQHYARMLNSSTDHFTYGFFDNHNNAEYPVDPGVTTGLLLRLALPPSKDNVPEVLRNVSVTADPFQVGSQGSFIPNLLNGNALMGYGQFPVTQEFGTTVVNGTNLDLLRQWRFGADTVVQSYRGFKYEWHATPAHWNPSIYVEESGENEDIIISVYVSWNGATEVTDWEVYAGPAKKVLSVVGRAAKKGFETTFNVSMAEYGKCVQVGAVQGTQVVRNSTVECVPR